MASASTNILPLSGDSAVDVITNGTRWILPIDRTVTWSISDGFNGEYWNSPTDAIDHVAHALEIISYYADITFEYLGYYADPDAAYWWGSDINISMDGSGAIFDSSSVWAGAFFPYDGFSPSPALTGDVFLNLNSPANYLPSYEPGSQGWFLLLHELGHALGLKHTHDDGGTGRSTLDDLNLGQFDRDWLSVMSYEDDFNFNMISFDPATPMLLDVIGLQYLYGKNMNANAGNSVYALDSFDLYYTIWDAGGNDTLSAANASEAWHIVLPYAVVSSAIGEKFGYAMPLAELALPSPKTAAWIEGDIENAVGSAHGDQIIGNGLANRLSGRGGDDVLLGRGGNDVLNGGAGDDVVRGGPGHDRLIGASGHDRLLAGGGNDVLVGHRGNDVLNGGGGNDDLRGGGGNDRLVGGAGNDWIVGHAGNDRLIGNAGADSFVFQPDGSDDLVVDFQDGLDRLVLRAFDFASKSAVLDLATQAGADVLIALPDGATIELNNFDLTLLGTEDILI